MDSRENFQELDAMDTVEQMVQKKTLMDLPSEILVQILQFLDIQSITSFGRTCTQAASLVNDCDYLWKYIIAQVKSSPKSIKSDREEGCPWKEVVKRNFGKNGIRRLWMDGHFSNIKCIADVPADHMCELDVDTWGQIFDAELKR